tara:strand:+ start:350 stop:607 length:258 start_codon:yes stop_codon:yes gene_type:complete
MSNESEIEYEIGYTEDLASACQRFVEKVLPVGTPLPLCSKTKWKKKECTPVLGVLSSDEEILGATVYCKRCNTEYGWMELNFIPE